MVHDAHSSAGGGPGAARASAPDRVLGFTDGVFAIIITILVLELVVPPDVADESLRTVLEDLWPTFVAWVISFLLTGMYWVSHRDLFAHVRAVNRDLLWLNLLFLLPVCLIPFASSVLGEHAGDPVALRLYGGVMVTVTVMRLVLTSYLRRRPALLWDDEVRPHSHLGLAVAAAPLVVYALAIALAGVSTEVSLGLYLALPGLYFLLVTLLRDRPATALEARDLS